MIYTPLTIKAMKFAYDAHQGQTDSGGAPYIFHPLYVAELVCREMPWETPVCVALLHDVVTNTEVTIEQIEEEFPRDIVQAVALLTYEPGEDYYDYIDRINMDSVAVHVKIQELQHDMDKSRMQGYIHMTEKQKEKLFQKYEKALAMLTGKKLDDDVSVYRRLDNLRKEILPHGKEIMKEHRFEIFAAIDQMLSLLEIARVKGLEPLCEEGKRLLESDLESDNFIALGISEQAMIENCSLDIMLHNFDQALRDPAQDFIRYIYMRGMTMMLDGLNPVVGRTLFISLLPEEERVYFENHQKRKKRNL